MGAVRCGWDDRNKVWRDATAWGKYTEPTATCIPDGYAPTDAVVVRAMDKWLFNCASMPAGMLTDQEFGVLQYAMREAITGALSAIADEARRSAP